MTTEAVPVLDIGGTHVTAALFDPEAISVVEGTVRRDPLQASGSAASIVDVLVECASGLDLPEGATWGIALPGPFDYDKGIGRFHDVGKFDALNGFDLGSALLDRLPGKPAGVRFLNDAHAFALGEWAVGSASGHSRALALTLGTGIGSAFIDRGSVVDSGPTVPTEGRADLLSIDDRPLEETVSRRAILARFAAVGGRTDLDVSDIAALARTGDEPAAVVLREAFRSLGEALLPWVRRFGATIVIVGGSMAGSWDLIAPPLSAGLDGVSLVKAKRDTDAALIGAGLRASGGRRSDEGPADEGPADERHSDEPRGR